MSTLKTKEIDVKIRALPPFPTNRYKLQEPPLGKGSFGAVYLAREMLKNGQSETVAIKKIVKSGSSPGAFLKEFEVLQKLKAVCSQHILCYRDVYQDAQFYYLVTEYLGGFLPLEADNLKDVWLGSLFPIVQLLIINNLILGLQRIHSLGVAHRDIKPDNILVKPSTGEIKYIDFGQSCWAEDSDANLVQFNQIEGTERYLDPALAMMLPAHFEPSTNSKLKRAIDDLTQISADFKSISNLVKEKEANQNQNKELHVALEKTSTLLKNEIQVLSAKPIPIYDPRIVASNKISLVMAQKGDLWALGITIYHIIMRSDALRHFYLMDRWMMNYVAQQRFLGKSSREMDQLNIHNSTSRGYFYTWFDYNALEDPALPYSMQVEVKLKDLCRFYKREAPNFLPKFNGEDCLSLRQLLQRDPQKRTWPLHILQNPNVPDPTSSVVLVQAKASETKTPFTQPSNPQQQKDRLQVRPIARTLEGPKKMQANQQMQAQNHPPQKFLPASPSSEYKIPTINQLYNSNFFQATPKTPVVAVGPSPGQQGIERTINAQTPSSSQKNEGSSSSEIGSAQGTTNYNNTAAKDFSTGGNGLFVRYHRLRPPPPPIGYIGW
jgi:serine/threonine protein kinase